jgi:hypothetical protein
VARGAKQPEPRQARHPVFRTKRISDLDLKQVIADQGAYFPSPAHWEDEVLYFMLVVFKEREVCPWYNSFRMPTVLRSGPYRFYFYSHEPNEPPHVHVDRDALSAKFWLDPVALARNLGFNARDLGVLYGIIVEHQQQLLEAWHGYFGARRG